jgi:hypothetical protein
MKEQPKEDICKETANISAEQLQRVEEKICQCEECTCTWTAVSAPPMICEV